MGMGYAAGLTKGPVAATHGSSFGPKAMLSVGLCTGADLDCGKSVAPLASVTQLREDTRRTLMVQHEGAAGR
jgi:hypothetical protein